MLTTLKNQEWHAPNSHIFDCGQTTYLDSNVPSIDTISSALTQWLDVKDIIFPIFKNNCREQRIQLYKGRLRQHAMQFVFRQKYRTLKNAKRRLAFVARAIKNINYTDHISAKKICCLPDCRNNAMAYTTYCYLHITKNTDQFLFFPCTAKFSDNSQCRVPVFDICHELPLCREHAWKRDNYNRLIQEQKPKKTSGKKNMLHKYNRKGQTDLNTALDVTFMLHNINIQKKLDSSKINLDGIRNLITYSHPVGSTSKDSRISYSRTMQNISSIYDHSSYESSEDTAVEGLNEIGLISNNHDVIEEIPLDDTRLLEEHDLNNVLNQLPEDAFNELFTTVQQSGALEPTQEEQEYLERALESVDKQVKSLQQMTAANANFLGDFLDVDDQILSDTNLCNGSITVSSSTIHLDPNNILLNAQNETHNSSIS